MKITTYTDARKHLASLLSELEDNQEEVFITRNGVATAVIISVDEYNSLRETDYLLRSPKNRERLLDGIHAITDGTCIERTDL